MIRPSAASLAPALAAGLLAAGLMTRASPAWAWGATGHRLIGQAAILALPADLPAFLRSPAAAWLVGEGAREPDRSKGAGVPHDPDLDPGHFLNVDDAGRIAGGPALGDLPPTREAYDAALRAVGSDSFKVGYLPYAIEDGYQQLVRDFAWWRVETAALNGVQVPQDRAWIAADLRQREMLTLRDLGYWAHFVGDGSQPMHVSIHHNGWGEGPNPHGYTSDKIHAPFEGAFVHDHVSLAGVTGAMTRHQPCGAPIAACTARYLAASVAAVEPLYARWASGAFASASPDAVAFVTARVAAGASELRDLAADAWTASGSASVGYKPDISVRDAEAGHPVDMAVLKGGD